ncbi:hypothetical protein AVEN_191315-1 [Araneus ventricosus]|uniref:Uncharacterized protein n=1 Tax=Araneus ventricosus TaxID=182803 RepID=A0A4Y2GK95_ARAVE|nr:hypothetical protein AVEN_191315-1 [Araneus ventricosus]
MKAIRSIPATQRKLNLLNPVRVNKSNKQKSKEISSESDTDEEIECDYTTGDDDGDSVEFDLPICEDRKPQINDYVVVKFPTEKKIVHFVGIVEAVKDDEVEINFLKKCNSGNGFVSPEKEDRGSYSYGEICLILPPPNEVGGTYRCPRKLVFHMNYQFMKDCKNSNHRDYQCIKYYL